MYYSDSKSLLCLFTSGFFLFFFCLVPESLHLDKMVEKVVECVKKAKSDGSSPHLIIIEGTMVLTIE